MTTCKNCSHEFEGKFCPACGQKAKTSRITIRQVLKEARDHFIHFDQGFLFTIKELTLRPGHTIREYIEGKRVQHIKPLKFMFWATAISFFVAQLLGFQEKLMKRLEEQQGTTEKSLQFGQKLMSFITSHQSLLMLFIIPTIALVSWLLFRKKRYNFAEYFTMNAYLMGQLSLLSMLTNIFLFFWLDIDLAKLAIMGSLQWIIWVVYYGWAYGQFFKQPKKVSVWVKAFLVLIGGYTLMILLISGVVSTVLYFFKPQIDAWMAN